MSSGTGVRARLRLERTGLHLEPSLRSRRLRRSYISARAQKGGARPFQVCVIGAGVAGLTSAYRVLQECPNVQVTVVAERLGTDTTSSGAAGIWGPYKLSGTSDNLVHSWSKATHDHLALLHRSSQAAQAGVSLVSGVQLLPSADPPPFWRDIVFNFSPLNQHDLSLYPAGYRSGFHYSTFICEGKRYLQWLLSNIVRLGGRVIQQRVVLLDDVVEFDLVVDCCGLEAGVLFNDPELYPIRGQILRVAAPWVNNFLFADPYYVIPNRDYVVLGGTAQQGNWSTVASVQDRAAILEGCYNLLPSLREAEVTGEWVGLRPGRSKLRLDVEYYNIQGKTRPVVHNYGHGGAGLTLAWGCAGDVLRMTQSLSGAR